MSMISAPSDMDYWQQPDPPEPPDNLGDTLAILTLAAGDAVDILPSDPENSQVWASLQDATPIRKRGNMSSLDQYWLDAVYLVVEETSEAGYQPELVAQKLREFVQRQQEATCPKQS